MSTLYTANEILKSRIVPKIPVFFGLLLAACPSMWAAQVQCADAHWTSGTTFTVSLTGTAAGNELAVAVTGAAASNGGGNNFIYSISDGTNTYASVVNSVGNDSGTLWNTTGYKAENIAGGNVTLTVTTSNVAGGIVFQQAVICEFSGRATSSSTDGSLISSLQTTPGGSANAITSGSITTTQNGDDLFGFSQATAADGDLTVGNTVAWSAANNNSTNGFGQGEYFHQTSAGSIAATFTAPVGGTARNFISGIIALKPAGGGGGGTALRLTVLGVGR